MQLATLGMLFLKDLDKFSFNFFWAGAPMFLPVFVGVFLIYAAFIFLFPSIGSLAILSRQGATPSNSLRSCFYMPCSTNPISEMDQAGTLFIGLVLFVVGEIVVPVRARFKKVAAERRNLEPQVAQRFSREGRATTGVVSRHEDDSADYAYLNAA
jgi:hypothetical protein